MIKLEIYEQALLKIAENCPESPPEDDRGCGNEDDAFRSGAQRVRYELGNIALKAINDGFHSRQ